MRTIASLGVMLAVACSSGSRARAPDATSAPQVAADPQAPADPDGTDVSGPTPPIPPPEMVEQMIGQLVLDHPRVAPFLHVQAGEPLRVWAVPELGRGAPRLQAGGRPVQVVATPGEARFVFRAYEVLGPASRVRIRFEIPAEGASGHVDVELRDYVWRATGAEVVER